MTRTALLVAALMSPAGCSLSVEPRDTPTLDADATTATAPAVPDPDGLSIAPVVSVPRIVARAPRCAADTTPEGDACIRWDPILDLLACGLHRATRLDDGRVRVEGDCWVACFPVGLAFFDSTTDAFDASFEAPAIPMGAPHTETALHDGRVLAIDERGARIGTREPPSREASR